MTTCIENGGVEPGVEMGLGDGERCVMYGHQIPRKGDHFTLLRNMKVVQRRLFGGLRRTGALTT